MEVWKKIEQFDSYSVSNKGMVINNYTQKIRKPIVKIQGYVSITFYKKVDKKNKSISIHRLVALAFLPNPENKPHVNHINGIKTDNRVENLEWVTASENEKHSYSVLNKKSNGIIRRKIPLNEIKKIFEMKKKGFNQKEISIFFNVSQSAISFIVNKKTYIKHV
jgi:predicted XRE-type DNA-binding protein